MATRPYVSNWEYLVEPLEFELRQVGAAGFTMAAQTALYATGEEKKAYHEKILLEELTNLRGPLQRATEYVNQMMHELEPQSPKRRRTTENLTGSQSSWNGHNGQQQQPKGSHEAAVTTGEGAADTQRLSVLPG